MLKKFMRFILGIFGALIGYQIVHILGINHQVVFSWKELDSVFLRPQFIGIVSGWVVGFFLISYLIERLLELILNFEGKLKEITWKRVVTALLGLITGIIFGAIINFTFSIPKIPPGWYAYPDTYQFDICLSGIKFFSL